MLDYKLWVQRALEFTESLRSRPGTIQIEATLHPPLSWPEVQALNGALRLPLPEPICAFLTSASSNCRCWYWWEPPQEFQSQLEEVFRSKTFIFGGASLCDSSQFVGNERGCWDTGEPYEMRYPEAARLWTNSVPFHACGNGDYIGLYVGDDKRGDEFPVVYLDHDGSGGSGLLSPNFDQFLADWEKLRYIHGSFLGRFFLNPIRGSINPDSPKKAALDALFRSAQTARKRGQS